MGLVLFLINIIIGYLIIFSGSLILKMLYIIIISVYLLLTIISLKLINPQNIYCKKYLESPLRGTDIAHCFILGIASFTMSSIILSTMLMGFSIFALITIVNTLFKMKESMKNE